MTIQSNAANEVDGSAQEQIDVARIRITDDAWKVAVLGEFRAADRLMDSWVQHTSGHSKFEVEVTFLDGYVFCCCYEASKRGKRRPSLSAFVRSAFEGLLAQQLTALPDLSRYAIESW